jgi:hypothetical protein
MNTPVIRILVLVCIIGLAGLNCETPAANNAPTISALSLPDSVPAGEDATFGCTATDPDGDVLAYSWTCTSGTLQSTTGKMVGWTAPLTSGAATVTVVVQDSSGASDTLSGTLAVGPLVATIIDWSGEVGASAFQVWHVNVQTGYTLSGSFSAGVQRITFLVLDPANYTKWGFPDSAYVGLVKVDSSSGTSFSTVVPKTALYHFILDNQSNPVADTLVHLTVQTTSP